MDVLMGNYVNIMYLQMLESKPWRQHFVHTLLNYH